MACTPCCITLEATHRIPVFRDGVHVHVTPATDALAPSTVMVSPALLVSL